MTTTLESLWAIAEGYVSAAERADVCPAGVVRPTAGPANSVELIADGVALVEVRSVLHKNWWADTPLPDIGRALRAAADSQKVSAILLAIDSPGGTVAGTADAADAVAYARSKKPVVAFVQDLAASAAYWIASQADRVYANQPSAMIGSIGTYGVMYDTSKLAEKMGVKVHVIRAGEHKGAGEFGTEITAAQIASAQQRIDEINSHFVASVAAGRRMSVDAVKAIADGRVHLAKSAQQIGLVDGIKTFDGVVAELVAAARDRKQPAMRQVMSTATTEGPKAATLSELRAACPGAPADWLLQQLEANATTSAAQAAFISKLQADATAEAKKRDEEAKAAREAEEARKKAGGLGVSPLPAAANGTTPTAGGTGDPIADFNALMRQELAANNGNQAAAVAKIHRTHPAIHQAYLLATNDPAKHGQIKERFARAR